MGTTFFICGVTLIGLGIAAKKTKDEKLIKLLAKRKASDTDESHFKKATTIPVIMGIVAVIFGIVMSVIT